MKLFGTCLTVFLFGLLAIWSGCEDPNPVQLEQEDSLTFEERLAFEEDSIDLIIESEGYDSVFVTESFLRIIPLREGNGTEAQFGDILTLSITGELLNGFIFETTDEALRTGLNYFGTGRETPVRNLPDPVAVDGLNEALTYMREGSRFKIFIPSYIGWGSAGIFFFNVGPNRILTYDVSLINIRR